MSRNSVVRKLLEPEGPIQVSTELLYLWTVVFWVKIMFWLLLLLLLIQNQLDTLISQIYFWNKTLHVSTVPLSIIRSFSLYTPSWSCLQAVSKTVWHISLLCVEWKTPDDGHRNCSKHVDFHSKNKFGKLMHPVGFIIRIYHDARSPECQISFKCFISRYIPLLRIFYIF